MRSIRDLCGDWVQGWELKDEKDTHPSDRVEVVKFKDVECAFRLAMQDLKEEITTIQTLMPQPLTDYSKKVINQLEGRVIGLKEAQDVLKKRFGFAEEKER